MNDLSKDIENFDDRGEIANAVVVSDSNSPAALTRLALTHGQSLADIKEMLALQKEYEGYEAKKAYHEAVARFKENPPEILKDKKNSQFNNSGYTSLGNLLKTVGSALGEYGLSASFEIEQEGELITVSCKLSHRLGHSESVSMSAPPDKSGGNSKNPIQQIKSTITYLRSVTFEAVTGLAATDANLDDDGNTAGKQPEEIECINKDQLKNIESMMIRTDINSNVFLKSLKVDELKNLPVKKYDNAMGILNARLKNQPRTPGQDG